MRGVGACKWLQSGSSLGWCRTISGLASSRLFPRACRSCALRRNASAGPVRVALPSPRGKFLKPWCTCCVRVASGRLCPRRDLAAQVPCTSASWSGRAAVFSSRCGSLAWRSTTSWRALHGDGRAWTRRRSKHHWPKNPSDPTRRIGEKNGSKRHLLVDGRGVPLSIVVTGANVHDSKRLDQVLTGIVVKRAMPTKAAPQAPVCRRRTPRRGVAAHHQVAWLHPARRGPAPGSRRKTAPPCEEGAPLGRRGVSQLVQPTPQAAGALREATPQLHGAEPLGRSHHRVPQGSAGGWYYLRIVFKSLLISKLVQPHELCEVSRAKPERRPEPSGPGWRADRICG